MSQNTQEKFQPSPSFSGSRVPGIPSDLGIRSARYLKPVFSAPHDLGPVGNRLGLHFTMETSSHNLG
jgi:hypothetical protein